VPGQTQILFGHNTIYSKLHAKLRGAGSVLAPEGKPDGLAVRSQRWLQPLNFRDHHLEIFSWDDERIAARIRAVEQIQDIGF
jgi:hypothetical protein